MRRREFLGGAARAAIFSVVPGRVLGLGGVLPPSERIGMGFIGLGGQGAGHLLGGAWTYVPGGYVARDDVQVLAVCDVRRERRESARARCNEIYAGRFGEVGYRSVEAHDDFREVLARPDIDAVLLALPYHWAGKMATMAARAGKDVYCEKPVCITVREGRQLVETVRRHGRVYQAGTQQRSEYGGKFRRACELIRGGHIGELREVYAFRQPGAFYPPGALPGAPQPVPEGLDWDMWLGPLPGQPYCGHAGHALPGNFVGDVNWSPHHYDIIQWVLGADRTGPVTVEWEAGTSGTRDGEVRLRYANGVVVHSVPYPGEAVGSVGGACFVGTEGRISVDRDRIVSHPEGILRARIAPGDAVVSMPVSHADDFVRAMRARRPAICDVETAHRSMSAILVGGIAIALRRGVRWDPAREEFPGDGDANRLLSYAPRAPWGDVP